MLQLGQRQKHTHTHKKINFSQYLFYCMKSNSTHVYITFHLKAYLYMCEVALFRCLFLIQDETIPNIPKDRTNLFDEYCSYSTINQIFNSIIRYSPIEQQWFFNAESSNFSNILIIRRIIFDQSTNNVEIHKVRLIFYLTARIG